MEQVVHEERRLHFFEKYLTVWVLLCIGAGILLGKLLPDVAVTLDRISIYQVSIPIAVCLFFMMYPIMVKIDFAEVVKAGKTPKPVMLTLFINWCVKPFTMLLIATLFLGVLFKGLLPGSEIVRDGSQVELYRSYISGCILLGIAPCTAMVLIWGLFFALHLAVLGYLVYKSGYIPRVLGIVLLVASLAYFAQDWGTILFPQYAEALAVVGFLSIIELAFPVWLLIKGVRDWPLVAAEAG